MNWSAWIAVAIAILEAIREESEKRGAPDVFGCSSFCKV